MTAQVHIQMLCRKSFSPLHKQSNFISFHRETCTLQGTGSILNRFATVADRQWNMKQHRINIHTCASTSGTRISKAGSNNLFTQILYLFHHFFKLVFHIKTHQIVRLYQKRITTQRFHHSLMSLLKVTLRIHTQSDHQTSRQQMNDFFKCRQRLFRTEPKHIGKQGTCKHTRTLLQQSECLCRICFQTATFHFSLPNCICLTVEYVHQLFQIFESRFTSIFRQTQCTYHTYPHFPFRMHHFTRLLRCHRQIVQPKSHHFTLATGIFQF